MTDLATTTLVPTLLNTLPKRMHNMTVDVALDKLSAIGHEHGTFQLRGTIGDVTYTLEDLRSSVYYGNRKARTLEPCIFLAGPSHAYRMVTATFLHYAMDHYISHLTYMFKHHEFTDFFAAFQKVLRIDENYA